MMHEADQHHPPKFYQLREDVFGLRTYIVNVGFINIPRTSDWILVDTGIHLSASHIIDFAEKTFNGPPKAILLTHGHFDHVGSLEILLKTWNCKVYAHEAELPYLTGKMDYPPGDPTVGGGLMAWVSPLYPHKGIDLGSKVQPLPGNGTVPELDDWKWVHTPGHSPGHVSFFREADRTLLAGDAFITVNQESAFSVLTQKKDIQGPPTYFTPNWEEARSSVQKLEQLQPRFALTGHGEPMDGDELKKGLQHLTNQFEEIAMPKHGRYVPQTE